MSSETTKTLKSNVFNLLVSIDFNDILSKLSEVLRKLQKCHARLLKALPNRSKGISRRLHCLRGLPLHIFHK